MRRFEETNSPLHYSHRKGRSNDRVEKGKNVGANHQQITEGKAMSGLRAILFCLVFNSLATAQDYRQPQRYETRKSYGPVLRAAKYDVYCSFSRASLYAVYKCQSCGRYHRRYAICYKIRQKERAKIRREYNLAKFSQNKYARK